MPVAKTMKARKLSPVALDLADRFRDAAIALRASGKPLTERISIVRTALCSATYNMAAFQTIPNRQDLIDALLRHAEDYTAQDLRDSGAPHGCCVDEPIKSEIESVARTAGLSIEPQ